MGNTCAALAPSAHPLRRKPKCIDVRICDASFALQEENWNIFNKSVHTRLIFFRKTHLWTGEWNHAIDVAADADADWLVRWSTTSKGGLQDATEHAQRYARCLDLLLYFSGADLMLLYTLK